MCYSFFTFFLFWLFWYSVCLESSHHRLMEYQCCLSLMSKNHVIVPSRLLLKLNFSWTHQLVTRPRWQLHLTSDVKSFSSEIILFYTRKWDQCSSKKSRHRYIFASLLQHKGLNFCHVILRNDFDGIWVITLLILVSIQARYILPSTTLSLLWAQRVYVLFIILFWSLSLYCLHLLTHISSQNHSVCVTIPLTAFIFMC